MRTARRFINVEDKELRIEIGLSSFNEVSVTVFIPCRRGQCIILDCNNKAFYLDYNGITCKVSWCQNTQQFSSLRELLDDISTWFKYHYAIRLEDSEDPYTI